MQKIDPGRSLIGPKNVRMLINVIIWLSKVKYYQFYTVINELQRLMYWRLCPCIWCCSDVLESLEGYSLKKGRRSRKISAVWTFEPLPSSLSFLVINPSYHSSTFLPQAQSSKTKTLWSKASGTMSKTNLSSFYMSISGVFSQ